MSRDLSVIGHALSAPVRSTFVTMLLDGSTRPATELAHAAGVSASTASEHLGVLLDTGLLTCIPRGRQRFYAISDADVAAALEQLGHLCPEAPAITYRQTAAAKSLAQARLCYDHLAGRLGTQLAQAAIASGWLDADLTTVTPEGDTSLQARGIATDTLRRQRRTFVRPCPDWTERHPHIAGALGAAIATSILDRGWAVRAPFGRGLTIPSRTAGALEEWWNVRLD